MSRNLNILLGMLVGSFIMAVSYRGLTRNPMQAQQNAIATAVRTAVPQMVVKAESIQHEFEYDGRAYFSVTCEKANAKVLEAVFASKEGTAKPVQYEFEYDGRAYLSL